MGLKVLPVVLAMVIAGCAPTTGPVSLPLEVLVILDRDARTLTLIPVDSTSVAATIPLNTSAGAAPSVLAVRGAVAAAGYGADSLVIVDLVQRLPLRYIGIGAAGPIAALAFRADGRGLAASPRSNRITAFDPPTGELFTTIMDGGPQGFGIARGTVFVVLGNRQNCYPPTIPELCTSGPSWLSPLEGVAPFDSIPLPGPGNAGPTVTGPDGLLYVLHAGDGNVDGRLSVVDPVLRKEIASFSGFGIAPQFLATDGLERVYVASVTEGLMVFDTRDRRILRGAGQGVPLDRPLGLLTDASGHIYVLEAGPCAGGSTARVRVFGSDLVPRRDISTTSCPVAMALTEIPGDLLGFDN